MAYPASYTDHLIRTGSTSIEARAIVRLESRENALLDMIAECYAGTDERRALESELAPLQAELELLYAKARLRLGPALAA